MSSSWSRAFSIISAWPVGEALVVATSLALSPHAKNVTTCLPTFVLSPGFEPGFASLVGDGVTDASSPVTYSYSSIQHSGRNASTQTTFQVSAGQNISSKESRIFTASDIWIFSIALCFSSRRGGSNRILVSSPHQCLVFSAEIGVATITAPAVIVPVLFLFSPSSRCFSVPTAVLNVTTAPPDFSHLETALTALSSRTSSPAASVPVTSPRVRPPVSKTYSSPWFHTSLSIAVSRKPIVDREHPKSLA
mmetsp:Transcript_8466/g.31641  ORF Transcript_8466/g.31641 Transcript_8466/m.31641 type:complete len:249 (+) Transcript_8466:2489-3235(+)